MNQKALRILEFDKIRQHLTDCATSDPGREKCRSLFPSTELEDIQKMQAETSDALSRLIRNSGFSCGSVHDIRPSLRRLEVGASLTTRELLDIASLLENTARVKAYGRHDREDTPEDSLDPVFDLLEPVSSLASDIRRAILSEDEIADDASAGLRQVRRSIKSCGDKIHAQLNSMINGNLRTALQDAVITMRDGRYCLPVRSDYRSQVPGMIHDQSSTGATLFIEPMSVVKLNNEIRQLEIREQEEIAKVLAELSADASVYTETLRYNYENLAELDFIFARARLALVMNATRPVFNTDGRINLRKARHPLIEKHKVVPIDIRLGETFDLLVITGPNTGGKTVSLKTTGLLTLMGQSGLHIPAGDRSELSVFREVYADIGDEQSIEQSLSTFSSHMKSIVSFLEKADRNSLVLFDELGAGTDPAEGAALAISILSYLHRKGVRTMATTHYSELKVYALTTEGVENASCEFNVETLQPTYRLMIGVPGKSNAFAISLKLGLPESIIEDARKQISEQDASFEDVLSSLEENRVAQERKEADLERLEETLSRRETELKSREKTLEQQKDRILSRANEEAHAVLQEAKEYADQTMKEFRKFGKAGVNSAEMERKRNELRKQMDKTTSHTAVKASELRQPGKKPRPQDLTPGTPVRILSMNLKGTVNTRPDSRGNLFVQCGILRTKVHMDDLELADEPEIITPKMTRTSTGKIRMNKSASVSSEINLLGKTVDEAVAELDKYLDDAYIAHLKSVRVIHGKGTGALRKGIHNYLRTQKHVADFHLAEYGEGDAGVTIVEFKQ